MALVEYPYDPNGNSPANLVKNEKQTLSQINGDPFRYLIPVQAPFYVNNFSATAKNASGSTILLKHGIDYQFNARYIGATRANGMAIYGAVIIINKDIQGPVTLQYQCLGGAYSADRDYVIQTIAQNNYNPRRIAWDQVTNAPTTFPPSGHPEDLDTFTGFRDLNDAIYALRDARVDPTTLQNELRKHILDVNDPHKTLAKIPTDYIRRPEFEAHTKNFNDPHRTLLKLPADLVYKPQLDAEILKLQESFDAVPSSYKRDIILVKKPHLRLMVWDVSGNRYVRAPWAPAGMMQYSHANPTAILGYLPVRGDRTYNQADYPDLAAALGLTGIGTFALTEMRGEFLRVLDNGRGVDVSRANLSFQNHSLQYHNHYLPTATGTAGDAWVIKDFDPASPYNAWHKSAANTHPAGDSNREATTFPMFPGAPQEGDPNATGNVGFFSPETRPRNVAASLWISY